MKTKSFLIAHLLLAQMLLGCACDSDKLAKGFFWGFNKIAGEGYFPSPELIALGEFEGVDVAVKQSWVNGENESSIELKLYNGRSPDLLTNEANLARKCAEMYAANYSKINDFKTLHILFVRTDPMVVENYAVAEYNFEVKDLLTP